MSLQSSLAEIGIRVTRDDAKWWWLQVLGFASLIAANVANLPAWFAYIGVPLTDVSIHRISAAAAVALFLGGRYGTSPLDGK